MINNESCFNLITDVDHTVFVYYEGFVHNTWFSICIDLIYTNSFTQIMFKYTNQLVYCLLLFNFQPLHVKLSKPVSTKYSYRQLHHFQYQWKQHKNQPPPPSPITRMTTMTTQKQQQQQQRNMKDTNNNITNKDNSSFYTLNRSC